MNQKNLSRKQSGAVLLAFMLILVAGTSYLLLNRLNDYSTYARDTETQIALLEAKKALLSYAMNYPELRSNVEKGPGFLPCPDHDDDGNPQTACTFNAGDDKYTTFGRLPYRILGLSNLTDSSGEYLWYAVSNNFKNTQSDETVLNSETPGLLSVNNADGSTETDIVAVIIAPGEPLEDQNGRRGVDESAAKAMSPKKLYLVADQYLEGSNADYNNTVFEISSGDEFNDQVITITRQELMEVVEKRVIGEVKKILTEYKEDPDHDDSNGTDPDCPILTPNCDDIAYPWLTPFTDPKADSRRITGTHSDINDSPSLTDASRDFIDMGIKEGDVVHNITDGSLGIVDTDPSTPATLTFTGLQFGSENDFDTDDIYIIYRDITGTASGNSTGLKLVDTATDFNELGITAGDIVDNTTDIGSSGMIDSVSTNEVVVTALSGGAVNSFSPDDGYRLRSNTGRATGVNNSTNLVDSGKDFTVMGVQAGDLVINLTDGSFTTVSTVATDTLTLNALKAGTENDFDINDYYYLPRYNTDNITRKGLLSFHETGKHFKTAFSIDWDITPAINTPGTQPVYDNALRDYAGGTATGIDITNGICTWIAEQVVDCKGVHEDEIVGNVTSGSNTSVLTDANARFTLFGVKRGDIVQNYDDQTGGVTITADAGTGGTTLVDSNIVSNLNIIPYQHVINTGFGCESGVQGLITEIIDNNTVTVQSFAGNPAIVLNAGDDYVVCTTQGLVVTSVFSNTLLDTASLSAAAPDFDASANEFYGIMVATDLITGTVTDAPSGNQMEDSSVDFINAGVRAGDVVENITDGSFCRITAVTTNTLTATLYGGSSNDFQIGDQYQVFHSYIKKRRIEFNARFAGTEFAYMLNDQRKRDVCLGYNSDCSAFTGNVTLPGSPATPTVIVRDYDINDNEITSATVTIPAGGTNGSIRLSGLDYYLHEANDELPEWFAKNKWHQLVYVSYSGGLAPGGTSCAPGTDCLNLSVDRPWGTETNIDIEALLVMSAGGQLAGQDRSTVCCPFGAICPPTLKTSMACYFENANAINDLAFDKSEITDTFNDQISVIVIAP